MAIRPLLCVLQQLPACGFFRVLARCGADALFPDHFLRGFIPLLTYPIGLKPCGFIVLRVDVVLLSEAIALVTLVAVPEDEAIKLLADWLKPLWVAFDWPHAVFPMTRATQNFQTSILR